MTTTASDRELFDPDFEFVLRYRKRGENFDRELVVNTPRELSAVHRQMDDDCDFYDTPYLRRKR